MTSNLLGLEVCRELLINGYQTTQLATAGLSLISRCLMTNGVRHYDWRDAHVFPLNASQGRLAYDSGNRSAALLETKRQ